MTKEGFLEKYEEHITGLKQFKFKVSKQADPKDNDFFKFLEDLERNIFWPFKISENKDKKIVDAIRKRLKMNAGYCPCQAEISYETYCPCQKMIEVKDCCCNLWINDNN